MYRIQQHLNGVRLEVTERDLEILRGLFESRLMTLSHIATLYFEGNAGTAKKRVQKLKAGGIIGERPRRTYEPSILFLTKKAFRLLADDGHLAKYPRLGWSNLEKRARVSELTLAHEINVMDVKTAFVASLRGLPRFRIAEFSTWPLLYQFRASHGRGGDILVKPDGYIRVHEEQPSGGVAEQAFFLEVDRSTEPQETLAQRAACYRDYYQRGGLAARSGHPRSEFDQFPFRVLMVFRNAERRNNTAEKLLTLMPPILNQVWLTTFAEVTTEPLARIWLTPRDYRDLIRGTAYSQALDPPLYRRNRDREQFIEQAVGKHTLLTDTLHLPKS